ncbi:MAG: hypothetical protein ABSE97_09780 [Verrucomicrobiota bacterium]|jgi:hypothetical protein
MNSSPNNQVTGDTKSPRRSDKIATYIARGISCCIGITLLITFVVVLIKGMPPNFENLMMFGAIIGLCLGYGLGGDIWGARLFGLFAHLNTWRRFGQDGKPSSPFIRFMSKTLLFIFVGVLVLILALIVRAVVYSRYAAP